jgi:hypothetical protein
VFYISESTIPFLPGCTILYFHWFFFLESQLSAWAGLSLFFNVCLK